MKPFFLLAISSCSFCLLVGCGGGPSAVHVTQLVATHFSVTPALATPIAGTPFNFTVTALDASNNAVGSYAGTVHFSSSDAQAVLPANSMLTNGMGTFSATLKTASSETITATDSINPSITGTSTSINVISSAPTHFSISAPGAAVSGTAFSFTVTALSASNSVVSGYAGTVHFSSTDVSAVLPANSTLTNGVGNFSATLKTTGAQTIAATDTVTVSLTGTSTSISVSSTGSSNLTITSGPLPPATVGQRYGQPHGRLVGTYFQLTASGGTLPFSWSWAAAPGSSLPPAFSCCDFILGPRQNPIFVKGAIFGLPNATGTYNVVVTVKDSASPPASFSASYTIVIDYPPPPIINTTPPPAIGTLNSPYVGFTFSAAEGFPPFTWSETGTLPNGLNFSSGGVLSGMPTAAGSFPITVMVQDSLGRSAVPQDFQILVLPTGFTATGSMGTSRTLHTATVFRHGLVLVTGGVNASTFPVTAELFNSAKGSFSATPGNMNSIRVSPTANLLPGEKVLLAGGKDGPGNAVATAEIFDSATGAFTPTTGNMQTARVYHTATLLTDGTVLLAGGLDATGNPTATAELFDPATGTFSSVGSMASARFLHAATLLPSGKVLVTGGLRFDTAEIYDPVSKTFTPTGNMTVARAGHTITALTNGKILITGGASQFAGNSLSSAELFDPATGTFTATANMLTARSLHTATLRKDGTVLVAGGDTYFFNRLLGRTLSAAELFDPVAGTFTPVADMTTPRESHTATLLLSGQVLIVGGSIGTLGYSTTTTVLATAELYP